MRRCQCDEKRNVDHSTFLRDTSTKDAGQADHIKFVKQPMKASTVLGSLRPGFQKGEIPQSDFCIPEKQEMDSTSSVNSV